MLDPSFHQQSSVFLTTIINHHQDLLVEVRGWNGAALTALGEMAVDFFGAPFPESDDGVKLGESTLNLFLLSEKETLSAIIPQSYPQRDVECDIHLSDWCAFSLDGS